jgi:hypothetical protein
MLFSRNLEGTQAECQSVRVSEYRPRVSSIATSVEMW